MLRILIPLLFLLIGNTPTVFSQKPPTAAEVKAQLEMGKRQVNQLQINAALETFKTVEVQARMLHMKQEQYEALDAISSILFMRVIYRALFRF
ncbi:MAG: hypothetical protein IPL65_13125 [Lewinellaceae bacterium]|nr:hypothetical protein [Lewinellaceae bacterium]